MPLLNKVWPTLPPIFSLQTSIVCKWCAVLIQPLQEPEHSGWNNCKVPKAVTIHIHYFIWSVNIQSAPTLLLPVVGARNPEVTTFLPSWSLESAGIRELTHVYPGRGLGNLVHFLPTAKTQEQLICFSLGSTSPGSLSWPEMTLVTQPWSSKTATPKWATPTSHFLENSGEWEHQMGSGQSGAGFSAAARGGL